MFEGLQGISAPTGRETSGQVAEPAGCVLPLDSTYVLNAVAKYLARSDSRAHHNYNDLCEPPQWANYAESWRFPLVDNQSAGVDIDCNRVTFVWRDAAATAEVTLLGTFLTLHRPVPLQRVLWNGNPTDYRAVSVSIPHKQAHRYLFLCGDVVAVDPINPQRCTLSDGRVWSRFHTEYTTQPIVLNERELALLERLTDHILPFRTGDGRRFLEGLHREALGKAVHQRLFRAWSLDNALGAVSFIDKLLACQESYYLVDYHICLDQIDRLLRDRNPGDEPAGLSIEAFIVLYDEMATNTVDGWDYQAYAEPRFFLQLLRRHTYTGVFAHPRYGGNLDAAGWAYLEETFRGASGQSCFAWRDAIEPPIGSSQTYQG